MPRERSGRCSTRAGIRGVIVRPDRYVAACLGRTSGPAECDRLLRPSRPLDDMTMHLPHLRIPRISWHDLALTLGPYVLLVAVGFWFAYRFVRPAPPGTIVLTSGSPGSLFDVASRRYRDILARQGVTLEILPSEGSLENLKRLADPDSKVDVGFVQGGLADRVDARRSCPWEASSTRR
jgi:TRAP-type uncharacterized transport system, periplasmic component